MITPRNEMGVVVLLAQEASRAGVEIVDVQSAYPDMILEKDGVRYRAEVEYRASNFIRHGHDPLGCDLIICWENDLQEYTIPVVELSDPDWHAQEWEISQQKDKEIFRLKAEIARLQAIVKDGTGIDKANEQRKADKLSSQREMLDIFRDDPNASYRSVGRQIGRSASTVSSWIDELGKAGAVHVNGNGVEVCTGK